MTADEMLRATAMTLADPDVSDALEALTTSLATTFFLVLSTRRCLRRLGVDCSRREAYAATMLVYVAGSFFATGQKAAEHRYSRMFKASEKLSAKNKAKRTK